MIDVNFETGIPILSAISCLTGILPSSVVKSIVAFLILLIDSIKCIGSLIILALSAIALVIDC